MNCRTILLMADGWVSDDLMLRALVALYQDNTGAIKVV